MKKIIFLLTGIVLSVFQINAQKYTISGTVEESNGDPVYMANVYLDGTTLGTVTNNKGEFKIKGIKSGKAFLVISRTGYSRTKKEIDIDSDITNLSFVLDKSAKDLGAVTVTGTGTPHHIKNAPVKTEIISEKNIKEISPKGFEDMMKSISPSFDFTPNVMGSFMKLNGLGNDYILMMVDGQRLYGGLGGQIDMNRINPENIERVEIVKGASSALYGSEAMGGVVNIITKEPKNKVRISNNSVVSSYSTWQQTNNIDLNFGDFSSHTSFTHKQTDGWQLSPYEYDSRKDTTFRTDAKAQNAYMNKTFKQKVEYAVTNNLEIYASGKFYKNDRKRPESVRSYNLYFEDQSYSGGAKYIINNNSDITFDYHSDLFEYYYKYNQNGDNYSEGDKSLNKKQRRDDYEVKWVNKFSESHRVSVGSKFSSEQLTSKDRVVNDEADAYTMSVYAQDEMDFFDELSVVLGSRFTHHKEFGSAFTPKLTLMYQLNDINLRANYAKGYKNPTLKELYYRYERRGRLYLGNTDLEPQESDYYAATFEYNPGNTSFSISGYRNDLTNKINYQTVDPANVEGVEEGTIIRKHANIEEAMTQGIDLLFHTKLAYGFTLGGGYSFVDALNLTDDIRLEGVAQNYANVRLNYANNFNWYHLDVSLLGRIQDEKFYENRNADAYNIWKLSTTHTLKKMQSFEAELTIGIDNLFDYQDNTPYGYHYGTLNPGRTIFAGLRIRFMK